MFTTKLLKVNKSYICYALRDLVPFVHPWRSVTFSKSNTPPWVFFTLFKLYKWYQMMQRITYNNCNKDTGKRLLKLALGPALTSSTAME